MTAADPLPAPEPIPFVDLGIQHARIASEVARGWERILAGTSFILSDDVSRFETEFAAYVGVRRCVGVGNGTDAIELALRALGVGAGDEVVVPTNSFVASATAVARAGAALRFADVDPVTLLVDPASIAEQIGDRTKAVLPVHLFGQMAPLERIEPELPPGVTMVEDAAQSQGAARSGRSAGSWGAIAATSFYPGKNLGAYGDAGAVLTDSEELATSVERLRNHGSLEKYVHDTIGFNSRLDPLQAVVLSAKLERLDEWNAERVALADNYEGLLATVPGVTRPVTAPGNVHVWHLYVIRVPERDRVVARMRSDGVAVQIHYPTPIHLCEPFRTAGYAPGDLPHAEEAADEILSLPLFPGMTAGQQERVVESLVAALR